MNKTDEIITLIFSIILVGFVSYLISKYDKDFEEKSSRVIGIITFFIGLGCVMILLSYFIN
jgi:uncharacterized membrane protein YagU involved in acid resistance